MAKSLRFGGISEVGALQAKRDPDGATEVWANLAVLIDAASTNKVLRQFVEDSASVKSMSALFWRSEGALRELGLGAFPAKGTHHGQTLLMRVQGDSTTVKFGDVSVSKLSISPHPGRQVSIRFTVELRVGPTEWDWLQPALNHGAVVLEFVPPAQMDFADDIDHAEAAKEAADDLTLGPITVGLEGPETQH